MEREHALCYSIARYTIAPSTEKQRERKRDFFFLCVSAYGMPYVDRFGWCVDQSRRARAVRADNAGERFVPHLFSSFFSIDGPSPRPCNRSLPRLSSFSSSFSLFPLPFPLSSSSFFTSSYSSSSSPPSTSLLLRRGIGTKPSRSYFVASLCAFVGFTRVYPVSRPLARRSFAGC